MRSFLYSKNVFHSSKFFQPNIAPVKWVRTWNKVNDARNVRDALKCTRQNRLFVFEKMSLMKNDSSMTYNRYWILDIFKTNVCKSIPKEWMIFYLKKKSSMKNRSLKEKEFLNLILVQIKLAIAKRINNSEN